MRILFLNARVKGQVRQPRCRPSEAERLVAGRIVGKDRYQRSHALADRDRTYRGAVPEHRKARTSLRHRPRGIVLAPHSGKRASPSEADGNDGPSVETIRQ